MSVLINNMEVRHTFLNLHVQDTSKPSHLCSAKLLDWTTYTDYVFYEKKLHFKDRCRRKTV